MKGAFIGSMRTRLAASASCLAGSQYTVVHVDDLKRVELFLRDDSGVPFHRFEKLDAWLQARKKHLRFAMNAGMFEPDATIRPSIWDRPSQSSINPGN
jgi:uncharacterized protein YigE (DUF2233 family)